MRIESKRLTFWRAYWLFLAGMSLPFLGLLSIVYFGTGHLPWSVVKVAALAELFFFLWAYLMARFITRAQMKYRPCWQVTPTCVEVYDGERLLISLPWREVSGVTFRRGVMGLKMHRRGLHGFFLKGITQSEFEQVEAKHRAGGSQGQGIG